MRLLFSRIAVYREGIVPVSMVSGSEPSKRSIRVDGFNLGVKPSRPSRIACGV